MHNITVESELLLHLVTGSACGQEFTRMNILFAYRRMLLIIMINIFSGKCTTFCHKVEQECIRIECVLPTWFAYQNLYFDGSQIVHMEHLGLQRVAWKLDLLVCSKNCQSVVWQKQCGNQYANCIT